MPTTLDNDIRICEINGWRMTAQQAATARVWARAGYTVSGQSLGSISLRGRHKEGGWHWVEVNEDGRVAFDSR